MHHFHMYLIAETALHVSEFDANMIFCWLFGTVLFAIAILPTVTSFVL